MLSRHRLRILDLGCGSGAKFFLLRPRGRYVGTDIDLAALATNRRLHLGGDFVASGASRLPFSSMCLTEVHLYDVLEHLDDRDQAMVEVARVLRPGGRLVVEVPHWRSEQRISALLPTYAEEVGHRAVLSEADVVRLTVASFRLLRTRRKHGMQNLLLTFYARRGGHLTGQAGIFSNDNRLLDLLTNLCSEDLFFLRIFGRVPLWLFIPVWLFTLPVGWLVSQLSPKTIRYEFVRDNRRSVSSDATSTPSEPALQPASE